MSDKEINTSEALYSFVGWLTTRNQPLVLGSSSECSEVAQLLEEFCEINNLPRTTKEWVRNEKKVNLPKEDEEKDPDLKPVIDVIRTEMRKDPSYAHGWHSNIAMMCYDAMRDNDKVLDHDFALQVGNEAASRFMKLCFEVETSQDMLLSDNSNKISQIEKEIPLLHSEEPIGVFTALSPDDCVTKRLNEIGHLIRTQDNRITADPLFVVEREEKVCGVNANYSDGYDWFNSDLQREAEEEEIEILEAASDRYDSDEDIGGWEKIGYVKRWEFVTACFTEQGCKDYLKQNGHNVHGPTRIYAHGSFRNKEYQDVRNYLKSLNKPLETDS